MSETTNNTQGLQTVEFDRVNSVADGYRGYAKNVWHLDYAMTRDKIIAIAPHASDAGIDGRFVDEANSDPRYRESISVDRIGGEHLRGKPLRIVNRVTESGEQELQLEADVSLDESESVLCYFRLDPTFYGCTAVAIGGIRQTVAFGDKHQNAY